MTDLDDNKYFELSDAEKMKEAQKMINTGMPIDIICKTLDISPGQIVHLRQQSHASFK